MDDGWDQEREFVIYLNSETDLQVKPSYQQPHIF